MHKCDALSFSANAWSLVDQLDATSSTAIERSVEVVNGEADMMNAWTSLGDEFADWGVVVECFQELDKRFAGGKPGNASSISVIERNVGELQNIAVEGKDLVQRAHRDADVSDA